MILATLAEGGRDGVLLVVSRDRTLALRASAAAATLQGALDNWDLAAPRLQALARELETGGLRHQVFPVDTARLMAPLPRGPVFYDAACYPEHISVIRQARGGQPPADLAVRPLMYQGFANPMLGPQDPIRLQQDEGYGVDLEAEIVALTTQVPQGTGRAEAARHIRLLGLLNDVSLRTLQPAEIARGFGFLHSKPESAMGPFVVTPDELGGLWNGRMFTGGSYRIHVRGELLGDLDPGKDVIFDYAQLIEYAATTRMLAAGTLIGAGTLANVDRRHGSGCIAEQRAREQLSEGQPRTSYLHFGDRIRLELFDREGCSVFGAIDQQLEPLAARA